MTSILRSLANVIPSTNDPERAWAARDRIAVRTAASTAGSHKEQMLAEYDDWMQSAVLQAGQPHQVAVRPQKLDRQRVIAGWGLESRRPNGPPWREVAGSERVAVHSPFEALVGQDDGRQAGESLRRRQEAFCQVSPEPLGFVQWYRLMDGERPAG